MKEGILSKRVKALHKEREEIIEEFLRIYPDPIITGEITEGKIIWRGLRLAVRRNSWIEQCWIEQRGKQISPIITSRLTSFPYSILTHKRNMQEKEIHPIELNNG